MTPIERHEKPDRKPTNDKAICRLALDALFRYPRLHENQPPPLPIRDLSRRRVARGGGK
jgi:hypothetical protein